MADPKKTNCCIKSSSNEASQNPLKYVSATETDRETSPPQEKIS